VADLEIALNASRYNCPVTITGTLQPKSSRATFAWMMPTAPPSPVNAVSTTVSAKLWTTVRFLGHLPRGLDHSSSLDLASRRVSRSKQTHIKVLGEHGLSS
jgi:hypothetical protein